MQGLIQRIRLGIPKPDHHQLARIGNHHSRFHPLPRSVMTLRRHNDHPVMHRRRSNMELRESIELAHRVSLATSSSTIAFASTCTVGAGAAFRAATSAASWSNRWEKIARVSLIDPGRPQPG